MSSGRVDGMIVGARCPHCGQGRVPGHWTSTPPEREGWWVVRSPEGALHAVHALDLMGGISYWIGAEEFDPMRGWLWHTEPLAMPEPPEVGGE